MRYISLFSGIEAASVAWGPLGWTPVAFSEIDPFACAVLAHHWPGVPNHGDVTAFDWSKYRGQCDIVIGGSPCTAFSVAGLRKSLDDPRGQLTLAFVRACNDIDPQFILWENVPGATSTHDGAFGCFLAGVVGASEPLSSGDILHHIGVTGSQAYEATAVHKELVEAFTESGRWNNRPPDIVVRSHRHRLIHTHVPTSRGEAISVVTPGWQAKTPFAWKVAGARQSVPQFGGILIRCGDEDLFVRTFVRDIARPSVE